MVVVAGVDVVLVVVAGVVVALVVVVGVDVVLVVAAGGDVGARVVGEGVVVVLATVVGADVGARDVVDGATVVGVAAEVLFFDGDAVVVDCATDCGGSVMSPCAMAPRARAAKQTKLVSADTFMVRGWWWVEL